LTGLLPVGLGRSLSQAPSVQEQRANDFKRLLATYSLTVLDVGRDHEYLRAFSVLVIEELYEFFRRKKNALEFWFDQRI